jgi:lauroyl/myristoyl acyltransferase
MLGNEYTTQEEIMARLRVEGIKPLLDCYRENRKIIAAAVHTGPVDKMGGVVPLFKLKVYAPVEATKPDWLFKLMLRLRLEFQGFTFDKVERGMTLNRARHNLRSGKIVLLLVDALREDKNGGVACRIGNARVMVPVGAIKLALEEDAILFPIFPSWDEESDEFGVKIVVGAPFELIRTGDARRDIGLNTQRLIEEVFALHIQRNVASWQRLLWSKLEPVEINEQLDLGDPIKRIMMRTKLK